jgi:predicted N-acetyltransferase YhbS
MSVSCRRILLKAASCNFRRNVPKLPDIAMTLFTIHPELPSHAGEIDQITSVIFGPGMFARAAYKLREGILPEAQLSFVAIKDDEIIGSVRQTLVWVGEKPAVLLGPLGVLPTHKNEGIGHALMRDAVQAAKSASELNGTEIILLVGDLAYYRQFGFQSIPQGQVTMPRPVDLGRLLAFELIGGGVANAKGEARRRG